MVSLTRSNTVGGTAVTAGRNRGPHFMLRLPSKGFPGKHFLEFGLQVGVELAKDEFARLIQKELTTAQSAAFRGYGDSPTAAKAGVGLSVFENVSTGAVGITVKTQLLRAFQLAAGRAKSAAVRRFNQLDQGKSPVKATGKQADIKQSFVYRTKGGARGSRGNVSFGVQFLGSRGGIAKLVAQNFGLRAGTKTEAAKFKLNAGVT